MAQVTININKIADEIVEEIGKAKELYVNADPVERTKWNPEKKVNEPNGWRTELQIMEPGSEFFRQTFFINSIEKPKVAINDKVSAEITNHGAITDKKGVMLWYTGTLRKFG
ncbi:hypothetical protein [Lactococcus garvieae]|uniref:hypothetical protein n=1 Tax=Lactococcus garvieae TaxID=1363 RepID=UPI0022E6154D|nr:hypothetical protein [Lactococcus garvieae]